MVGFLFSRYISNHATSLPLYCYDSVILYGRFHWLLEDDDTLYIMRLGSKNSILISNLYGLDKQSTIQYNGHMIINGRINKKLREAIEFFASELFTPQMKRHIEVRIRQRDLGTWHGFASIDEYNMFNQPRSFVIEIHKNDSEEEKLKTLAHELIHCRQYARNELNDEMNTWKGRKVDSDAIDYNDQPWEVEANQLGDELYERYTNKTR